MKKTLCLLLCICLLSTIFVSCGSKNGTVMLSLEANGKTYTLSSNLYQLFLSRIKGTLVSEKVTAGEYTANLDAFWRYRDDFDGYGTITLDEYYKKSILTTCKNYLVGMALYDQYNLTLSEEDQEEIEKEMAEFLHTDGGDSKTKLNSVLSEFGVNYEILEEALTMEKKYSQLQDYLFNNSGDTLKMKYLEENYLHFHQIFLPLYVYVYETDANGDVIYYNEDDDTIAYDKENGVRREKAGGNYYTDDDGYVIYYVAGTGYTNIAYDKENGSPAYSMEEDGTTYVTRMMSAEEANKQYDEAEDVLKTVRHLSQDYFEQLESTYLDSGITTSYSDGYYLSQNVTYSSSGDSYAYLDEVVAWLKTAEVGDIRMFTSDYGYHIVRKYANTDEAYNLTDNTVWFESFPSGFSEWLMESEVEPYLSAIQMDQSAYDEVPEMAEISPDYYY